MVKCPITTRLLVTQLKHGSIVPCTIWVLAMLVLAPSFATKAEAQNAPLISGGVGFLTSTNGGVTNYQPVLAPVAAVPLGERFLVESRAFIEENYAPKNGNSGPYQG